jgi:magnesium transporter
MALDRKRQVVLESLRRFLRRSAHGHLVNLMAKTRPQDYAPIHEEMNDRERSLLFRVLGDRDPELGADFLSHLPHGVAAALLPRLPIVTAARLLDECDGDDAARLLSDVDDEHSREILAAMHPEDKAVVEQLLIYEDETAGRIMTPSVFALREETTLGEAVAAVQSRGEDVEMAFYLYVIDERDHLVGVLSLRELLTHPPHLRLKDVMNVDLITARADTDQEEVAQLAAKYDLLAVPVTDERGRLVGMVTIDDVVDVLREEATEDIYLVAGTSADERIQPSIWKSARIRSPWLLAAYVGGMLAMLVIRRFDTELETLVGLAALLPVVLGVGGSAGNQSAIVIIRGLATGRVEQGGYLRNFLREMGVATLLGLLYGGLVAVGTYVYGVLSGPTGLVAPSTAAALGRYALPAAAGLIGLALTFSMLVSTTIGALIPLALHRVNIDPAVSTTPFVTTVTDVAGSAIFFLLATLILTT